VDEVLNVATKAAAAFVPGSEAIALLEGAEGFRYRARRTANDLQLPDVRLSRDDPLLAGFANRDPQQVQLQPIATTLRQAGLQTAYAAVE